VRGLVELVGDTRLATGADDLLGYAVLPMVAFAQRTLRATPSILPPQRSALLCRAVDRPILADEPGFAEHADEVARFVTTSEERFVSTLRRAALSALRDSQDGPTALGQRPPTASPATPSERATLRALAAFNSTGDGVLEAARLCAGVVAQFAGRTLTDEEANEAAILLRRDYPAPVEHMRDIMGRALQPDTAPQANDLWDWLLSWYSSNALRVDDAALMTYAPILLVTDENRILDAARQAGALNTLTTAEFADVLSGGPSRVDERLAAIARAATAP